MDTKTRMTSLREEIIADIWGTTPKDSCIVADKILARIERRIYDEIWDKSKGYIEGNQPMIYESYYRGYMDALKQMKEMLK